MEIDEIINAATYCLMKGYNYETMKYCDTMYGKESYMDEVWGYVEEAIKIGSIAFQEKYKEYQTYPF